MTAEEQIAKWAAKQLKIDRERIEDVAFVHEDGWTSDAGTYWPPEAHAVVKVGGYAKKGQTKSRRVYIPNADTTELIRDILSA